MEDPSTPCTQAFLTEQQIQNFFVTHLDRIYCVKSHLQERLQELSSYAGFIDLNQATSETQKDVDK